MGGHGDVGLAHSERVTGRWSDAPDGMQWGNTEWGTHEGSLMGVRETGAEPAAGFRMGTATLEG